MKGRKQRVKINAEYSTWKEILNGVPQGSVLGPLLFNLFINDLFLVVENCDVCNYADDNSLSVSDISIKKIINTLAADIFILENWFKNNGMLLNEECQFLIIESAMTSRKDIAKIQIQNKIIEESKKGKLLGITFDNNITMSNHIENICKQASNKLYTLTRISRYLNEQRKMLMKSFIISQFNYCPLIWMYCQRNSNNLINRIDERALKIAYDDYVSDFHSLLEKDNSVTIHQKNIQLLTLEIYKTQKDLKSQIYEGSIFYKETQLSYEETTPLNIQTLVLPYMDCSRLGTRPVNCGILYPEIFKKLMTCVLSKASPQNTARRYVTSIYANFM